MRPVRPLAFLFPLAASLLWCSTAAHAQDAPQRSFRELCAAFELTSRGTLAERAVALKALTAHRTPECVRYLDRVRAKDRDAPIRILALRLLGEVGVDPARVIIEEVLDGGRPEEKRSALLAYSTLRPLVPPARFLTAAREGSDGERFVAAKALAEYPQVEVGEALAELLEAETPSLARRAVSSLRAIVGSPPADAWFVETALAKQSPYKDRLAQLLRVASACGHEGIHAAVARRLRGEKLAVRAAAARALGELDAGRGAEGMRSLDLLAPLLRERKDELVLNAAAAIGHIGAQGKALDALLKLCGSGRAKQRAVAIGALGATQDPRCVEAAARALGSDELGEQAAAVATLRQQRSREAVGALVAGLKTHDSGRLQAEIARALRGLTGADMGRTHADWGPWWESVAEDYALPDPDAPPGDPAEAVADERRTRTRVTYFGNEVVSERLAFIVDISGSMVSEMRVADSTVAVSRLEVCKRELRGVIEALEPQVQFNLVAFADAYRSWSKRIQKASKRKKKDALEFVNAFAAKGGTNIFDPLRDVLEDPRVDTVWLLSDGDPTSGDWTDPADILTEIRYLNAPRRVAIHCISVGIESKLLQRLAAEHGGTFSVRGLDVEEGD